jgi:hypothetical protein
MENANDFRPRWDLLREFPPRPSRDKIREWLVRTTDAWEANRDLINVVYQGVAAEPELMAGQNERAQGVLSVFVDSIRHLGWKSDTQARVEAMLLFAQLERVFSYWSFEEGERARDLVLDLLTENWWAAFSRAAKST